MSSTPAAARLARLRLPSLNLPWHRAEGARKRRRFPFESALLFLIFLGVYIAASVYVVLRLDYINVDFYARVANAHYILFARDAHLAALGFSYPPLPTLLDVPILLFKPWFPVLATKGFAGSIQAALFSAGTVVLLNGAFRRARVIPPLRWLLVIAWGLNPMILLYATQGMSEPEYCFFIIAAALRFMSWSEDGRAFDLVAAGLLMALGVLVRWEMVAIAAVLGGGIVLCSIARKRSWREIETNVLLYALPVAFSLFLWIGSMAVIKGDPLYVIHNPYAVAQGADVSSSTSSAVGVAAPSWYTSATYSLSHWVELFPAILPIAALLILRMPFTRRRRVAITLLAMGLAPILFHVYLIVHGGLAPNLRYSIDVIPITFVLICFLFRELSATFWLIPQVAAVFALLCVCPGDIFSAISMRDPLTAREESVAMAAVQSREPVYGLDQDGKLVADRVASLDTDHGLIALDSYQGFPIIVEAPDPKIFVITNDEDFEKSIASPGQFNIAYFLVPAPNGPVAKADRLNTLYPSLWDSGGGFATLVANVGGGNNWRLYRITGIPKPANQGG